MLTACTEKKGAEVDGAQIRLLWLEEEVAEVVQIRPMCKAEEGTKGDGVGDHDWAGET